MLNDQQLGKKLVEAGKVTEAALAAALAEQKRLIMEGRAARLGELLVQRGLCSAKDVQEALAGQGKKIGECESCGARFNVVAWAPNRLYRCGKCQGVLRPVEVSADVSVSGTKVMPAVGSPPPAAKAKQKLGNITLMRELGRGGMGVVYQGLQEDLRRTVAVKVLLNSDDAKLKARFLREARVVSKLRHPNIVGVHELGEAEGKAYFTMDFIEGGPLNALFAPERLPVKELLGIVATMARALDYAHRQGLVHRDIKPQNILVTSDGVPFLSDFGLAREVESSTRLTMSGAVMGTPSYMSPEQARGEGARVDHRSDLYSLGAVLYEGLTGRPPFDGKDLISLLEAIVKDDPVPPTALAAGVPRDVETICLKALDRNPERRYQSGEEFAADVERFVKGEAIAARRSGAMEKGVRWARRRPALVAAAGAALSVALVAGIVLWRSRASAEAENERRGREIAEATERARVAREERERFERKLQELEERLAQAKTDEEKERIRREIEAAKGVEVAGTGVETPKPPDPPAKEKAWAAVEAKVKARMDGHRPGEALKELEAFEASTEEDREWKSEREGRIRTWIEEGLKEIEAAAAAHEAAGDTTAALDAWAPVLEWGVEAGTQRAEQERARILEVIVASARAEWNRSRLAPLTRTVGDALCAGDFAGAAGEVEKAALEPGADPGAISDLRWITGLATGFREAVFAHAAGQPVETFKYESDGTATVVEVAGESFRIRLPNGAVLPVAWGDVQPSSFADIVRKAGGDEDAIALFWWWWRPPEKLDKDGKMVARNQKRAAEMAVKSPNGARLTAFLEAWRVAGEAAVSPDPGAGPDPAPEGGAAPFAVPAARDPRGGPSRWTYGFGSTTEAADWMVGPRAPPDRFTGWGARIDRKADAEDGVLWLKDGLAGWTGSIARISRIRAQGTLVDAPEGRFGIVLGGFQAWITGGQFLWSAAPSGKSLGGNIDIRKPALNRPVTIELWFEERSINQLHVSVDGERLQSQSVEERLEGPTGVLCEDGSAVQWDWIEIEGVLDSDAESHLREFRSFVAGARYAAGAAKVLSDGKSLGAFKATGEGTWSASGGHLRGKSAGVGPRQEAILRAPGYRNCVLRFRYWAGSARNLMLEARAGAPESALRFVLPSDRAGEWRDVELVLAERCAWCTVDRTLPLFQLNPSGPVGDGELVLALLGGEAAVDDIQVLEIAALEEGSGPAWPWPPAPGPGMGPGPGPGPGPDGWASLWDGQTLEGFAKKEKAAVKNGELWVSGELATDADWPAVEIEMVFALEGTTRFSVGVRKDWLAKIEAGRGKHTLVVRAPRNGKAEVLFDGRPVDSKGGSSDVPGPFRLKVESGTVKIVTLRHRPPP